MKVEVKVNKNYMPANIFFRGNLVISNDVDDLVMMVISDNNVTEFEGVCIDAPNENYKIGESSSKLACGMFKQFHGTITISN